MSDYLRSVSVDGYIIKHDLHGLKEVNAIGVNINQIARQVNFQNEVTERDVDELRVQYEKLFEVVNGQILNG
ncbi:plasmid mobilization relaxosome protein MobC [Eubacteriaceae bacterium ES3]|nr:plasmid mobilization relaxosome protein MobC [Eubacteriaceae bacterium ES3]